MRLAVSARLFVPAGRGSPCLLCEFESFPFRHSLLILMDLAGRISFNLQSNQQLGRCSPRPDGCIGPPFSASRAPPGPSRRDRRPACEATTNEEARNLSTRRWCLGLMLPTAGKPRRRALCSNAPTCLCPSLRSHTRLKGLRRGFFLHAVRTPHFCPLFPLLQPPV